MMSILHENLSCEVLITNSCNMSCGYCIAKEMLGPTISRETGRKAIDMFLYLAEGGKTIEFTFSGGEPFIAFSTLEKLVDYANERTNEAGMQARFVLKTNGTILDRTIIDFLREHCVKVIVSIDGTPPAHNKYRRAIGGQGTHHVVRRNLLALLQNNISCVASITIHPDYSSTILDNVRYLHKLGAERIDIGPAYGTVAWTCMDNQKMIQSLMDVATYMQEVNHKDRQLEVGPIYRESEHVGNILSDRWGCHAASTNLAFLPNGQIAGCSALAMLVSKFPELILGNVFDGLDQQAVDHLIKLAQAADKQRPACQKCQAASNCTGGCLAINYSTNGSAFAPPNFYCKTISAIPTAWHKAWDKI